MVGRRRDQPDAWRLMADLGDVLVHLVTGKLAALARLCALRHLDLDIVGVHQIFGGDSETPRSHLLDRRTHGIALGQRIEAVWLLAPLARFGEIGRPSCRARVCQEVSSSWVAV